MFVSLLNFLLHLDSYLAVLIASYGSFVYALLFLIIFMETGLVIMPFLPGDSLLFIAGAFAASGALNVYLLFFLLSLAAILGDTFNYWLGRYFGEKIFAKLIKREHLEKTKNFFDKYGKKTIVLARFIPILRTFAPFVAGIGQMNYFSFLSYNIIGGLVWVAIFVFGGYFFGGLPYVKDNLTFVVILIIVISSLPPLHEYLRHKRKQKRQLKEIKN